MSRGKMCRGNEVDVQPRQKFLVRHRLNLAPPLICFSLVSFPSSHLYHLSSPRFFLSIVQPNFTAPTSTPSVIKMRPDGPRPTIIGPDSGPEAPFPLRMGGKVVSGFGRGSKEVCISAVLHVR